VVIGQERDKEMSHENLEGKKDNKEEELRLI